MNFFIDQEFIEDGTTIDLISIGLVAEDGRELYAVSSEFDEAKCDDWVRANVLPFLHPSERRWTKAEIRRAVEAFVGDADDATFWGYFADYDWVCFCRLWGRMIDLPPGFPKFCMDLKQWARQLGIRGSLKNVVPQAAGEHHALEDARWNRDAHTYLLKMAAGLGAIQS